MKKILNHIFIDGLSGMALGLFSTLIIGTIIGQIGTLVGNEIGTYLIAISSVVGCHCKPARKAGVYKKQDHPYHHPIARGGRFGDGPLCKQIKSHKIQDDR